MSQLLRGGLTHNYVTSHLIVQRFGNSRVPQNCPELRHTTNKLRSERGSDLEYGGGGDLTAEAPNSSNVKSDKHVLMTGPF